VGGKTVAYLGKLNINP